LITDSYKLKIIKRNTKAESLNVFWIGRLADFKAKTVCSIAKSISYCKNKDSITYHIVGDGAEENYTRKYIDGLSIKVKYWGHQDYNDLDSILLKEADILIGHGLSILKGARLGIPSIVANGLYTKIEPNEFKVNWIHNMKDYEVGSVSYSSNELTGVNLSAILENINTGILDEYGKAAYFHWQKNFSAENIILEYLDMIMANRFTYADFKNSGLIEKGLLLRIRNYLKPLFYKIAFNK
ncbi:MAG: glycosyltransferase family 4 protein, partial [Romboutsia sp.]|nr:glycosyltransferase family 4 protein [Romboutsia sp.]